jgi:hypothetical protein
MKYSFGSNADRSESGLAAISARPAPAGDGIRVPMMEAAADEKKSGSDHQSHRPSQKSVRRVSKIYFIGVNSRPPDAEPAR